MILEIVDWFVDMAVISKINWQTLLLLPSREAQQNPFQMCIIHAEICTC